MPMLRAYLSICVFACGAASAFADTDPVSPEARKKAVELTIQAAKKRAEFEKTQAEKLALLAHAKAGVIDTTKKKTVIPESPDKKTPIRFPNAATKKKFIADLEADLKTLKDLVEGDPKVAADYGYILSAPLKAGAIGRIHGEKIRCEEVVDKTTAVVFLILPVDAATPKGGRIEVVLSGIDTSTWADNMGVDTPRAVFVLVGNQKVGGTTYLHLAAVKFTAEEEKEILKAAKP
jgi:hypothetical protein